MDIKIKQTKKKNKEKWDDEWHRIIIYVYGVKLSNLF